MDAPTAKEIREWSRVDFDDLDFPEPEDEDPDPLNRLVNRGNLWLQRTTGRIFSSLKVPEAAEEGESEEEFAERKVEAEWLISSMQLASQMLTEYMAFLAQPEHAETASDFNQIQSFSAASYSETRRSPNARSRSIHPWSDLADLLYDLLTDEKSSLLNGDGPAIGYDDPPEWDVGSDIMGPNRQIITPFGRFAYPWDAIR